MRDEPIYYINKFSIFKHPKVWSKYDYWAVQIISIVIGAPIMLWMASISDISALALLIVLIVTIPGAAYNFVKGRERAERYKQELMNNAPFPYRRT